MIFRPAQPGDMEAIAARSQKPYDKLDMPAMELAIVGVDDLGAPRIAMGAAKAAILYMAIDHEWATPAMRFAMAEQAHREMKAKLVQNGYSIGYSFFPDGVPNGWIRRLVKLGWHRVIDRCMLFMGG